jgi:hypothetical protein
MRWIVTTSTDGVPGRTITSARTLRESIEAGRRWLERHPNAQRLYAHDTRAGKSTAIVRSRIARGGTNRKTYTDGRRAER